MCRHSLHHGPYLRIVMLSRQQLQRRSFAGVRGTLLLLLLLLMLSVMTIGNGGTKTTTLAFSITSLSPWQQPLTHKSQYRSLPVSSSSLSSSTTIETDGVPTSTTSTIVPSLQSYFIKRNVTIRSVHWCNSNCDDHNTNHNSNTKNWNSEASTLLQIYRGASIPPIVPNATTIMEQRMGEPSHTTNDRISYTNDHHRNDATASNVTSFETRIAKSMKESAELRATQNTIANIQQRLKILYLDHHICVVNKPSGVLSVPGPRRNPSVLEALYYLLHPTTTTTTDHNNSDHEHHHHRHMDQMVVHRLDMDTSGVLVFALSKEALQRLHTDFRQRRVTKVYQALLCHHISQRNNHHGMITHNHEYEINVDLERDPDHPPFMRIAQPKPQQHSRDPNTTAPPPSKFLNEASKPSLTEMHILSHEYYRIQSPHPNHHHHQQHSPPPNDTAVFPVTRVQLIPRTGRTHQLRVHMAHVLHHPIVGDDIYGYGGACFQSPGHGDDLVQRSLAEWGVPLCLHAQKLYIRHPISGAPMIFECEPHF